MAYLSLAIFCQLLDTANRDLKGSGRLHLHPRSAPGPKPGRNLYGTFIDQNVNASRILIVETAFDPCNGARRVGVSDRDNARALAILVWMKTGVD
jgi:hypothetical protein